MTGDCIFIYNLAALKMLFNNTLGLFGGHLNISDLVLAGLENLNNRL